MPSGSDWLRISTTIADEFQLSRSWSLKVAGDFLIENDLVDQIPPISPKNVEGTHADLAMRAFQLRDTAEFLAAKSYISRQDGRDFADMLWGQVAGMHIQPVLALVHRYEEVANERGTVLARFLFDVGSYFYVPTKLRSHSLSRWARCLSFSWVPRAQLLRQLSVITTRLKRLRSSESLLTSHCT